MTPSGAFLDGPREVSIAPNITTTLTVELAEGGAIEAEFQHEGKTTFEYEKGKPEDVKGDTFVAYQPPEVRWNPSFILGGTKIKTSNSNSTYEALTGTYRRRRPLRSMRCATPMADLFPFHKGRGRSTRATASQTTPKR